MGLQRSTSTGDLSVCAHSAPTGAGGEMLLLVADADAVPVAFAVAQSLHCTALQHRIRGEWAWCEGRGGEERKGEESCEEMDHGWSSFGSEELCRGDRAARLSPWNPARSALAPVYDPFRRARAQRRRPMARSCQTLQPSPFLPPCSADTSVSTSTSSSTILPDSPSARVRFPACQFARLAASGIPCFFPLRF